MNRRSLLTGLMASPIAALLPSWAGPVGPTRIGRFVLSEERLPSVYTAVDFGAREYTVCMFLVGHEPLRVEDVRVGSLRVETTVLSG